MSKWDKKTSMLGPPVFGLTAVTGPDGIIYTIGGIQDRNVEAYDPMKDSWSVKATVPTPRYRMAAATGPDGLIYVIGGADETGNAFNTVEAYDPKQDDPKKAWSAKPAMPTPRSQLAAATGPDGLIYAIGGADSNGDALRTVEAYNPSQNNWSVKAPMPTPRAELAAVTGADGWIYAIGGTDNTGNSLTTVEAYDPDTKSWTSVSPMSNSRSRLAAATGPDGLFLDGRIYAIDGQDFSNEAPYTSVEAYTIPCLTLLSEIRKLKGEIPQLKDEIQQLWDEIAAINAALRGDPDAPIKILKGHEAEARKLIKELQAKAAQVKNELQQRENELQQRENELEQCRKTNL